MLKVTNLHVHYGVIHAIKGVNFEVNEGDIVTLIGSNGAGKTTILKAISQLIDKSDGDITFLDKSLSQYKPHEVVRIGVSHVPEGRHVFPGLTVLENLEMGAYYRNDKVAIKQDLQKVFVRFPRLEERKHQVAGTLSGGEQQMLAIGRALMNHPKILLLDEPSMGLAPILVKEIFNIIQEINQSGTTILLVEQNANQALQISDKAYVLETGQITLSGLSKELLNNDKVKAAYLSA
ncbi:MAG: ABC transporter ATP-binding protein [Candidatus Izimaplasma sp.]|nr:ABC transporter ATP-binding protein [Candidatus Izimaplasma bacterium]